MLDAMNEAIRTETVQMLYRVRIEKKVEREEVAKVTGTNKDGTASGGPEETGGREDLSKRSLPLRQRTEI